MLILKRNHEFEVSLRGYWVTRDFIDTFSLCVWVYRNFSVIGKLLFATTVWMFMNKLFRIRLSVLCSHPDLKTGFLLLLRCFTNKMNTKVFQVTVVVLQTIQLSLAKNTLLIIGKYFFCKVTNKILIVL